MDSTTSIDLSLEDKELVILGTEYAGEMKKGVFTVTNYFVPKRGVLSMHCSATADKKTGASSLLFGLSGTGKTTLSADPKRHLIGDDEHCWSDDGIFNIEGGCYAKAINLTPESEPDIFQALRFGAVLENVVLDEDHGVDYTDTSITQNTRGAYPIEFIQQREDPVRRRPSDRRDLPHLRRVRRAAAGQRALAGAGDVSLHQRLHREGRRHRDGRDRAAGHVLACFGGPFLVWHPSKYAELLAEKMTKHNARVWLVNTGWSGGGPGVGKRISLKNTRAIIDAIHDGSLAKAKTERDPVFGFDVVAECPNVPSEILIPRNTWADKAAYDATAKKLAGLFNKNFETYAPGASAEVKAAAPKM